MLQTKGASEVATRKPGYLERAYKLKELDSPFHLMRFCAQKFLFTVLDLERCFISTPDRLYNYLFFNKFVAISQGKTTI